MKQDPDKVKVTQQQQYKPDQNFDAIAEKFQHNIYGTSKGRLRHELLLEYLLDAVPDKPLKILDAGGGSGHMAREWLSRGHQVHVTDISADMLAIAEQQCAGFTGLSLEQASIQDLATDQQYDLVICHAVLEWLQQPLSVLPGLQQLVKPQGLLSLSFFNRDARLFGNVLYGNFDYIDKGFAVNNRVRLNPNQALDPRQVLQQLQQQQMLIQHQAGIRCFHDYVRDKNLQVSHYDDIKRMERLYGCQPPFMWLGKYFHIIARRQEESPAAGGSDHANNS